MPNTIFVISFAASIKEQEIKLATFKKPLPSAMVLKKTGQNFSTNLGIFTEKPETELDSFLCRWFSRILFFPFFRLIL